MLRSDNHHNKTTAKKTIETPWFDDNYKLEITNYKTTLNNDNNDFTN